MAWVVFMIGENLGGTFDLEARLPNFEYLLQGFSLLSGLLTYLIFYFLVKTCTYAFGRTIGGVDEISH